MNYQKTGTVETAAAKAGFSTSTGDRINKDSRLPSQTAQPRGRRRPDPLANIFESVVVPLLKESGEIRPVAMDRELLRRDPELNPNIRRTLERRIRQWRALQGPGQAAIFRQTSKPGQMGISDFTPMNGVGVTIAGAPLAHRLYHFRLPGSGFCHAHGVQGGETLKALSTGLQDAVRAIGGAPRPRRPVPLSAAFRNLSSQPRMTRPHGLRTLPG